MISQITGLPTVQEESLYTDESADELGRDEFLKLFLVQLNYQDPLNPMDSTQFSAQLAQFSSLEQLFNINETLEAINGLQADNISYQSLDLIGKEIEAEGNLLYLEQNGTASGSYYLDSAADCVAQIYDADGYLIREIQLGALKQGQHTFDWDGLDQDGDSVDQGVYSFDITGITETGSVVTAETMIKGQVDRVNLEGSEPMLYIGEIPLGLSQVLDISVSEGVTE